MIAESKISPVNLLEEWGNFEDWENGAAAAPTGFVLAGAGAAAARESTEVKKGTYSVRVTYGSADASLYYDHPDYAFYPGRKVTLGFWVKTAVASQARIKIDDGIGSSQSDYHTGGGAWEFLTVEHDMDASATQLRVICFVDTTGAAYFDGGILCEGDQLFTLMSDNLNFYFGEYDRKAAIRQPEYSPARRHGIILGKARYDKLTLRMSGEVKGATLAEVRDNLDTVKRAVLTVEDHRVDKGFKDIYMSDDRFLRGQVKNFTYPRGAGRLTVPFDFDFVVPDPFDQAVNRTRLVQTISSSPAAFDLTVTGSAFTKPRIYFIADAGDITAITLENLTTGESISYTATVANGDTLVVDCLTGLVENDGTDDLENHTGDFLTLLPGTNKMKFTGSDGTIKIDYFERYL